jgi:hypothetical protein
MNAYLQYVHNLKGVSRFERFRAAAQNAILSFYIRPLDNLNNLERNIVSESNEAVFEYIAKHIDLKYFYRNIILTTGESSYVDEVDFNDVKAIINLRQVNNIQHPNKMFRAVNTMLPEKGIYAGRLETYSQRKELIYRQAGPYLGKVLWLVDFLLHRVIPRIPYLDNLYFNITNGRFRAISQAEILGRLVYCGFDIVNITSIQGLTYFIAEKARKPAEFHSPSYYPIIKLSRIGQHGKMIGVYKFRTMHPYSEYLQDYVIRLNGYNDRGKPANDFRVTGWGIVFRKLWIDELPQLINVVKGEMKLVGLRPLSRFRFNEFPGDLQRERIKFKPGCFPPYVALNMPDDKLNILAERIYIEELHKRPYTTDIRYFLLAVYNILASKIRSS